ncbi:MAG: protein translocase subunit SecF [Acutalibacteraceae bacterium]|nr:protein translocase subunit SecF [Acutalibacteraceae bacterium]
MADKTINTKKCFKIVMIVYAVLFVIGIIMTVVFGPKLDINFSGGTKISYSYTGEIAENDFKDTVATALDKEFTVGKNTSLAGDVNSYVITLAGKNSISAETQENITLALEEKFADNEIELYDSTSISPTIAGTFFIKSLVAVLITAVLVIIYVGIRFRKIGGVSAAITAFCALILDLLVAFFICVIFRLPIDMNFMAVVLTILGYSLNDTIVIYDRVRENKRLHPELSVGENMDLSVSSTLVRNIVTTVTTVCAVLTIVVVSEVFGLTSLRSFAIPMAFGLVSGCFSSLFVSGPLWVIYKERKAK